MRYRLPYWLKLFRMLVEEYGLPAVDGHDTNVGSRRARAGLEQVAGRRIPGQRRPANPSGAPGTVQLGPINNVTSFDAPPVPQALAAATRTKYVPEGAGADSDGASPTFTFAMFARPGPEPALNTKCVGAHPPAPGDQANDTTPPDTP